MAEDGRRKLGVKSEEVACRWLVDRGFKVVGRNFRVRIGEIDVVAVRSGCLYFVEVRSGRGTDDTLIMQSVGWQKLHKIATVGQIFAQKYGYAGMDSVVLIIAVNWYNSRRPKVRVVPVE